jgi:hypothetical protein
VQRREDGGEMPAYDGSSDLVGDGAEQEELASADQVLPDLVLRPSCVNAWILEI